MERRLAAILAADIVGFSRLVELDEVETLARQKAHLSEFIEPLIGERRGRIVKFMGDGLLAEFSSVVDAVRCAVEIQRGMSLREAERSEEERIRYRLAVHLGDVIFEAGDIYGDGVNVAARLEALASPGGLVVSGEAYDHLKSKLAVNYRPLGERRLKNISVPVRVYEVSFDQNTAGRALRLSSSRNRKAAIAWAGLLVAAGGVGAAWWTLAPSRDVRSPAASTGLQADARVFDAPTGPRIAVLPFEDFGEEDDWFADGLTEDVIVRLARFDDLAVIARNSTFRYKGEAVDVREAARELGADYVIEGSVRRDGDTLRVSAQLVDAEDGTHVWAERYDRALTTAGLFSVQDDVTRRVASALGGLGGEIAAAEAMRLNSTPDVDLDGYACVLMARQVHFTFDPQAHEDAIECLARVTEEHPRFASGWAQFSMMIGLEAAGLNPRPRTLERMLEAGERAVAADPRSPLAQHALGSAWGLLRDRAKAAAALKEAARLNPNDPDLLASVAFRIVHVGEFTYAKALGEKALELMPNAPYWLRYTMFHVRFHDGDYSGAYEEIQRIGPRIADLFQRLFAAIALVRLDRLDEAKAIVNDVRADRPDLNAVLGDVPDLWWWAWDGQREAYVDALAEAGLDLRSE